MRELFVPYIAKEKSNITITFIVAAASVGGFLVLASVFVFVYNCKRKADASKRIDYNIDENDTYGTYARGCDGDYEYDVAEVVDNNDVYGVMDCPAVDGVEVHDKNEYYSN